MIDRTAIFLSPGRAELATERCDLKCSWCRSCTNRELPDEYVARVWQAPPPAGTRMVRIRGGDPFRYGDLAGWVRWARRSGEMVVCVEGPAASLAGEDRTEIVAALRHAGIDGISVVLPTVALERTAELTGRTWQPAYALDSLIALAAAGVAIEIVFPVVPSTLADLSSVVEAVGSRLREAQLTLRRAPARDAGSPEEWHEVRALSSALASLPPALPRGLRLQLDPALAYPACVLAAAGRRSELFPATSHGGRRPLGDRCDPCAWEPHCTFRTDHGLPPPQLIHPLSSDEIAPLVSATRPAMGAEPRRFHTNRAALELPNLLCFAPWTTLTVTDPRRNPVPCALSWVESDMEPEAVAAELGTAVSDERERQQIARRERQIPDAQWYVVDNERLSLMELWNSPLLQLMRREMTGGEKSSRCRAMCRVVMGVEERGIAYFQRADSELTPAIVANRRLLREEIAAGRKILTAKPMDLVFGVSAHCNISCGFCDGPLGTYGDLTDRRRDEIIALLPTLLSFGVSGPGEPLMNKNFLLLLQHISDVGFPALSVSLTTNGTLLTPEFLARNPHVPWGSVRISLNSGSAETYARMTGGKRYFDRVLTNLDAICALRERSERPFSITVSLVLGSVQMGDLAKFAEIVHDHRTGIVVEPMYDDLRELSPWTRPERLRVLTEELAAVADSYVTRNPDISRAFRAVEQFARERLAGGKLGEMKGH